MIQESHSFSPASSSLERFRSGLYLRGREVFDTLGSCRHEVTGALGELRDAAVPLFFAFAASSGRPLDDPTYGCLQDELLDAIRDAGQLDGLLLVTHGAMVTEADDDGTGRLYAAVRDLVGPDLPIVATIDCHANVTRRMVDLTDAMVFYHTQPHVDHVETGALGARILTGILEGGPRPAKAFRSLPMVLPGENGNTTGGAFEPVMREVVAAERRPGVLSAGACAVQPWMDLAEYGCTVIVYAEASAARRPRGGPAGRDLLGRPARVHPGPDRHRRRDRARGRAGRRHVRLRRQRGRTGLGRHRRQHGAAAGAARRRLPAAGAPQHRRRRGRRCGRSGRRRRGGPPVDRRLPRPDLLPTRDDRPRGSRGSPPAASGTRPPPTPGSGSTWAASPMLESRLDLADGDAACRGAVGPGDVPLRRPGAGRVPGGAGEVARRLPQRLRAAGRRDLHRRPARAVQPGLLAVPVEAGAPADLPARRHPRARALALRPAERHGDVLLLFARARLQGGHRLPAALYRRRRHRQRAEHHAAPAFPSQAPGQPADAARPAVGGHAVLPHQRVRRDPGPRRRPVQVLVRGRAELLRDPPRHGTDRRARLLRPVCRRSPLGEAATRHPRDRRQGHQRRPGPFAGGARPDADDHPRSRGGGPVAPLQDAVRRVPAARPPTARAEGRRALLPGAEPVRRRPVHAGVGGRGALATASGQPDHPLLGRRRGDPHLRPDRPAVRAARPGAQVDVTPARRVRRRRHAGVAGQAGRHLEHAPLRAPPGERRLPALVGAGHGVRGRRRRQPRRRALRVRPLARGRDAPGAAQRLPPGGQRHGGLPAPRP